MASGMSSQPLIRLRDPWAHSDSPKLALPSLRCPLPGPPCRRNGTGCQLWAFIFDGVEWSPVTTSTSGFRAFNRKALEFLAENYPSDYPEPEAVVLLGKNNFTVKEVFTQMYARQGGVSSISLIKGPYYMIKVLLSMFMASIRSKTYNDE